MAAALRGATKRAGSSLLGAGRGATDTSRSGNGHAPHSGGSATGRHRKTPATGGGHTTGLRHQSATAGPGVRRGPGGTNSPTQSNTQGRSSTVKAALGRAARAAGGLVSRGARAGWSKTASARAAGRKKAASLAKAATAGLVRQIKKTPGALTDGLLATTAGLLSGLWHRSFQRAAGRVRDVWRKLRARRARKNTPDDTNPNTPGTGTTPAPVGVTARRPASTTYTQPTSQGGTPMSGGHHFVAPAMEMARVAANYQPQGMLQVGADFAGLHEALVLHAEAMKTTVENADASWPLAPGIVDLMREIYTVQIKAAELARELQPAFEQLHGVDLERLRNPRKGAQAEAMWDVRSNL
ncbi:hypothetical protein [Streptomyces gardneri]|uniref:hypothetical protein n=1 Tax=Streptomyces gardneri TaxID=66892 RepID=UPI003692DD9A